ncbi:MAG: hypothetical protein WAZ12_00690 [Candidatus Absconditicoccaceae bacterium]
MTFHGYKPYKKRNLLPKFTIVFLLGMSFALFFSNAFTIVTGINNAVQYVKQIVLTSDGTVTGTTGIVLDGVNSRISSNYGCDSDVKNCKRNNVGVWTDNSIITITGSTNNIINRGNYSIIGGGLSNSISGNYSVIPGGNSNTINANNSFAAGNNTSVSHNNTFIRNGSRSIGVSSIKSGTFIINVPNGMGINTSDPQADLDINGDMNVSGTGVLSDLITGTGTISNLIVSDGTFNGSIKVPSWSAIEGANDCSSHGVGAIRYDGGLMELCVCDGSLRKKVYSGAMLCVPSGGAPVG